MYYQQLGEIPHKRHTQYRQPDGSLYAEELVSSKGFSGVYSNLYHIHPPTRVSRIGESKSVEVKLHKDYGLKQTHLKTSQIQSTGGDFLSGRKIFLKNADVAIGLCYPDETDMPYYYKNAEADELLYIHEGEGILYSQMGKLTIRKGDYVVIPRTVIYRLEWKTNNVRMLVVESASPIETPRRYRNELGQLLEHSPYCERDIRPPEELFTEREK
ncbi:MAG: homogentisate 1,2-dioxygenase, partial [Cyclobacteriaceae bacterium]